MQVWQLPQHPEALNPCLNLAESGLPPRANVRSWVRKLTLMLSLTKGR